MIHYLLRKVAAHKLLLHSLCLLVLLGNIHNVSAQNGRGPYLLGPGDVVDIQVFRQPDLSMQARIQTDLSILLPVIGKIVIGGMEEQGAALKIQEALSEGNVIRDASVILRVITFANQQVAVLGFVNGPGSYVLERPSRISDALAKAGGAAGDGADYLVFSDFREDTGTIERHEILIEDIINREDLEVDRVIGDGDIIFVPQAAAFYIYGEVKNPGIYRLERGMTIEQAVARAGGVTELGDRDKVKRRDKSEGKKKLIRVGLGDLVQADDILYIGGSLF